MASNSSAMGARRPQDPESLRLQEDRTRTRNWKRWGPYLSDRQWGTVHEDYSADGSAWDSFPHDHARFRAYRSGEDGLAGISDRRQYVCFALALWNGKDPILKERLFGVSGTEGNHGEDVKEVWFHLDATPTHSFMRMLYKYPQAEYPYARLVEESRRRTKRDPELELVDTGAFDGDRHFDVFVTYAKASPEDLLIWIDAVNRGGEAAPLHLLPTVWFRNTWSWGLDARKPHLAGAEAPAGTRAIALEHGYYGRRTLFLEGTPDLLFTENETNVSRLWGVPSDSPFVKDAFHERVVNGREDAVNPAGHGTKGSGWYRAEVPAGGTATVRLRLTDGTPEAPFGPRFEAAFEQRHAEADAFYAGIVPAGLSEDGRNVMRQALAGMLWSKPLPWGGHIEQSDATSWMGMYCLNMGSIALELAREDHAYEDVASKFFEHFMHISRAMNAPGADGGGLWDEEDGFFFDVLRFPDGRGERMKVRSIVGLIPLFAVETLEPQVLEMFPGFRRRLQWFLDHTTAYGCRLETIATDDGPRRLLSLVGKDRLKRILGRMLDPERFLSDHGIRSLSKRHQAEPYVVHLDATEFRVDYEPAESRTGLFGGNSNWRGPVWVPVNFLLIESLQKYHHFFGDSLKVEFPTGSGNLLNLWDGAGLGASHQTGWTGLVAKLLQQSGDRGNR